MHALILAAGHLSITPKVMALAQTAELVIAADGGARHAISLGLTVTQWVGDFDSSHGIELNAPKITFPTEKDSTDLELALNCAKNLGASSATILGAFGGRFDHALGIALLAARETQNGFETKLESGNEAGWVITKQHQIDLQAGQTFSVLALEPCVGLTLSGAKWNLEQSSLGVGSSLGISNVALGEIKILVLTGCALLIAQSPET
jgi:thiamine pyrophosphokinase